MLAREAEKAKEKSERLTDDSLRKQVIFHFGAFSKQAAGKRKIS